MYNICDPAFDMTTCASGLEETDLFNNGQLTQIYGNRPQRIGEVQLIKK